MVKKRGYRYVQLFVAISFIFLGLFIYSPHYVVAAPQPARVYASVDGGVYDSLAHEHRTRVIIGLSPSVQKKDRVRADMVFSTSGLSPQKIRRVIQGGDIISADLTADEIAQLSNDPNVATIQLDPPIHAFLQDSVGIVNASLTAQKQVGGINLTGANQTICIIDTGVNYTHPSLGGCFGNNTANSTCKVIGGYDFATGAGDTDPIDDNGHGTHVAGIAAASGNITGIAPDAKIVALKVLNNIGGGSTSDLIAAIDWCVGNASLFNISVISMSLGDGSHYSSACDTNSTGNATRSSINSAVAKNITVVVSSGNDANFTAISSPACLGNATAITATNKADAIDTSYANRNSLVMLAAPGTNINSTMISSPNGTIVTSCGNGSSYCVLSGTSMAAPHVAGAIALLAQYIRLTGQNKTSSALVSKLNSTGKQLFDSSSGINYSRINIYAAIVGFDITTPTVTLVSPANATLSTNQNQTFRCNATDLVLKNVSFYLWNGSSTLINQTTAAITGATHSFEVNVSNISVGTYQWNCQYTDENNNVARATLNSTITISTLVPVLVSPAHAFFTPLNQTFSCNATSSAGLSNATFYLWNSTGIENTSFQNATGTENVTNFTYNFTHEDNYTWNCLFVNNVSAQSWAPTNFSVTYDVTPPTLTVVAPLNTTWINGQQFNVTSSENGTCLYSLTNGLDNVSMTSVNAKYFNASNTTLIQNSTYIIHYYCNDSGGNANLTTIRTFFADTTAPSVTLLLPSSGYSVTSSSILVEFNYTVADTLNVSNCSLYLNGAYSASNASSINQSMNQTILQTLTPNAYTWNINCTDAAGNIGASSERTVTINAPSSGVSSSTGSGGGGGGGGGTTTATYTITPQQSVQGYTQTFAPADKVQFTVFDEATESHSVTVDQVGDNFVNITIRSEPIHVLLGIGQSIKLNLTSPAFYDLYLKLESITDKKAKLTLQTIHESIPAPTPVSSSEQQAAQTNASVNQTQAPSTASPPISKHALFISGVVILLVAILVGVAVRLYDVLVGKSTK